MKQAAIREEILRMKASGTWRTLRRTAPLPGKRIRLDGRELDDFSSNDYLGLKDHPAVIREAAKALRRFGAGAGGSRLVCGNIMLYEELERKTARFKKKPSALVFSSGYALNVSVVPALVSRGDAVLCDRLNHASLIDGIRLSGARLLVYGHGDLDGLERAMKRAAGFRRRLVVTDTVFSMDGDIAPLDGIVRLARAHDCSVLIDEAHATGVLGPGGRGAAEMMGLGGQVDYAMGTYSKALGSLGGYVACGKVRRDYFINSARGLIFSTALPPAVLAASIAALDLCGKMDAGRRRLMETSARVRRSLAGSGFDTGRSATQIIPVILKDERKAVAASAELGKRGLWVPAIRFPAVRRGEARLRISLSAGHDDGQVLKLLEAMRRL